ncbi:hypothetical protein ACFWNL_16935 [Kitasatospora sp. NPDC058397]|uniref:hypothetical protein n=1 Tax=unclassified Kitasatospora TaxID=2633591 RepID=UPI003659D67D
MVDKKEAEESLVAAEALASRMRQGARRRSVGVFLLGLTMLVLVASYGLLAQPSVRYAIPVGMLIPLLMLGIHTATRPVVPRHHRALYAVVTSSGAGIYTLTVLLGTVYFSGRAVWWLPGAVLCAVPFFVIGWLERSAGHAGEDRP